MNIIENMVQGSDAWHQLRQQRFTASEAAAVFGDHKYMTRNDLLKQKKTGITPEVSEHQQRIFDNGHKFEAAARSIAEKITGEELYPCTCEDDTGTYLASMDGLDMLATFGWEHKTMNESLRTATAETLDEHYKWQMDHQMMVTGCERILFMASTGTEDDCVSFWYERDEDRIQRLIAGWEQFKADLEAYEHKETAATVTAEPVLDLPSVSVRVTGELSIASNFSAFESALRDFVENRLIEKPETDQDFADLESQIKTLKKAEAALDAAEAQLISQVATVDELKRTKDLLHKLARDNRLRAEKLVKVEKENRKAQIVEQADKAFTAWLNQQASPAPVSVHFAPAIAMKGKRTICGLQSAADDALAAAKVEAKQQIDLFKSNLAILEAKGKEHRFLFSDWKQLIAKQPEDLESTITARIAEHEQREQAKLEAERERIRREEEAKAKAEAEHLQREEQQAAAPTAPVNERREQPAPPAKLHPHELVDVAAEDTVTISRAEYEQLLADQAKLNALEGAGVDNWTGYSDAMEALAAA
jgi:putative phage-type endonuclease